MSGFQGSAIGQRVQFDRTIQLSDGRTLGYVEYGAAQGKPLFYFHGHPGSRLESRFLAQAAEPVGVRLIGVDRPGMGLSTFKPGRTLMDWPDDVSELAYHLGFESFAVAGFSAGGPYAEVCAYKIPRKLTACGIIAGVGRVPFLQALLARWLPNLLTRNIERSLATKEKARAMLVRMAEKWVEADQQSLLIPGVSATIVDSLMEAMLQGPEGTAYEGTLFGESFGFDLEQITLPTVFLWHGIKDPEIPVSAAREVARRIPRCTATFYPNDGHISVIVNHAQNILSALAI